MSTTEKTVWLKHDNDAVKQCNQHGSCFADSFDCNSECFWTVLDKRTDHYPASERINCVKCSMVLHENSHLHRCCICVIMASGLFAAGNNDFRVVCHRVSARLLQWSVPFLGLLWHTHAYSVMPHESVHASIYSHTYICTHKQKHRLPHKSISQTVKSKEQRWINRGTEDPHTAEITPPHDSIQGICPVTSKHALCFQPAKNMFVMLPSWGLCIPHLTGPVIIIQHVNGCYSSSLKAHHHPEVI